MSPKPLSRCIPGALTLSLASNRRRVVRMRVKSILLWRMRGQRRRPLKNSPWLLNEFAQALRIENDQRRSAALNQPVAFELVQQPGYGLAGDSRHIRQLLVGERHGESQLRFAACSGVCPIQQQLGQL